MVQLAHHERLREQIACQGAGEDAEVLAHHCRRVAFFVVGLSHLAIGVLYIEHAPAVVAYAKRCRATVCGAHGLRCKCRCASRPSNMLQLLVDGCQKARVLRPRHRVGYCGIWRHNAPTRDGLADHGVRCTATTACSLVCNGHHHFAVDILGRAELDARRCLRKAEDLTERETVAQIIRPQGKAFQCNLGLAAERLLCGGSAAVEVSARQAPVDQRLAHRDAWTLQAMVAILLKAAARDAAPRRVRYHAGSVVAYAQAHNGQYAGCARRIEMGVVAGGALARDQQHVGVLVSSSVRIFHHVEVVIVYAVALHVVLAKPKGKVHGRGSGPRAVCLCVHHQARATIVAVAHRGDTEQAFYAGNHCQLHVSCAEHASKQHVVARGFDAATLVLRHAGRIGVGVRNGVRCLTDVGVLIHRRGVFVVLYQCVDEMLDLSRVVAFCIRLELNARDRPVPIAYGRRDIPCSGFNLGAREQLGVGDNGGRCDKLRNAARLGVAG